MEPSNSHSHSSPSVGLAGNYNEPPFTGREEKARVGIGRRPLHYTGRDGWASRISYRTLYATAAGAAAGFGVGVYKGAGYPRWMGIMSNNFALVTAGFCGSQELVREIRAADPDDPLNCVPGGLISGGVLGRFQGGPSRALPCALLFAVVGTSLQYVVNRLEDYRLRRFIEISNPELVPKNEVVLEHKAETEKWNFPEWFPIQVLDEEAAAKRKAEKELDFKSRVDSLHIGERS
ncbi:hypothetical protein Mapa_002901 [Marchantia paleacea]|nr:hypothetical protein Mapa_002901 [Marchantia paleacea]